MLEVLRPGWPAEDDFLAIDHRMADHPAARVVRSGPVMARAHAGRPTPSHAATSVPRPRVLDLDSSGTLAEWSYRAGEARITQSALLLGKRSLALLIGSSSNIPPPRQAVPGMSISLWPESRLRRSKTAAGWSSKPAKQPRVGAQVLPIGLPSLSYPTDRGAFVAHNDGLVLNQASAGRRCLAATPGIVGHEAASQGRSLASCFRCPKSRETCGRIARSPLRVSWGRDETYIIYRSLAKPASRAFLGPSDTARFLVGRFNRDGVVEPILKVD